MGFFAQDDQDQFPVRVLSLQADSSEGERFYALFADSPQLTVPRGVGRLTAFARGAQPASSAAATAAAPAARASPAASAAAPQQRAAASAAAAPATATAAAPTAESTAAAAPAAAAASAAPAPASLQTIASFAASYTPDVFTREQKGTFDVLPISESRAWSLTGTEITALAGVMDSKQLRLALSVPGGFSETVSYFFYVFPAGKRGRRTP